MKKFLLWPFFSVLTLIIVPVIGLLLLIFFRPELIVNPHNLNWVLEKTHVLKKWSWKEAGMVHQWYKWNDRGFSGHFQDFCFQFEREGLLVDGCLEKVSWDLNLNFNWKNKFEVKVKEPLFIRSPFTKVVMTPTKGPPSPKGPPPNIWRYWKLFWGPLVPDMDFDFRKISVTTKGKTFHAGLTLLKKPRHLLVKVLQFQLVVTPEKLFLTTLRPVNVPFDLHTARPLYLRNLKLSGDVKESGIPLTLDGHLEGVTFKGASYIDLPLKADPASVGLLKTLALATKVDIVIDQVSKNIRELSPSPFKSLPAPLNVMDGTITSSIRIEETKNIDEVKIMSKTHIDLSGKKQILDFTLDANIPVNLRTFVMGMIELGVDFARVALQLPRLSKKQPPPQFMPDSRFKKNVAEIKGKPSTLPSYSIELTGENEKAMAIRTNLLDEPLRLNFDMNVMNGVIKHGYMKVLPLKTKVFKRPIHVKSAVFNFKAAQETLMKGEILFPLPLYKITLTLEGPLSKPRYAFFSDPPLSQTDIYAVLMFGRPASELDPEASTSAQRTGQLLAHGIFSLSALYFLAGSPVEYVGYDPTTKSATAQIGLGDKSSLRVGGGREGVNTTGIRRSLGKGWYLDTSVGASTTTTTGKNFGVMLERVIAY